MKWSRKFIGRKKPSKSVAVGVNKFKGITKKRNNSLQLLRYHEHDIYVFNSKYAGAWIYYCCCQMINGSLCYAKCVLLKRDWIVHEPTFDNTYSLKAKQYFYFAYCSISLYESSISDLPQWFECKGPCIVACRICPFWTNWTSCLEICLLIQRDDVHRQ